MVRRERLCGLSGTTWLEVAYRVESQLERGTITRRRRAAAVFINPALRHEAWLGVLDT